VILLDAFAVLAYLKGEPASREVRRLLEPEPAPESEGRPQPHRPSAAGHHGASQRPRLTAIGVAECIDHLVRLVGVHEDEAALDLAQLGLGEPVHVDEALARGAGFLRARHYDRRTCAVSLADCVAAEAARVTGSTLATADPHLLDVCRAEGIATLPLPGTSP
jgi:predicted nucleic acid-binding protein